MDGSSRCQRCDAPLTGQAIGGLCANCLLKLALEPPGQPTQVAHELEPGSAQTIRVRYFGDYELEEEIARGGMGVVYKARQVSLNRVVALKMILAGDFSSPAMVERFQTEAEAAGRLEHPNIVPIYEIGTHEGQHYFSMRFLEGGTLTQAMAGKKFTARRAAELMVKVARAVHHAHQRGILHRDLKPGNILLDAAGEPHVADFGLAKLLEHDSALTQSAAVMGTPSYMAPEQAAGETRNLSTAADFYSLGAVLYELLTQRPPFTGKNPLDVLAQVRDREATSPRSLNPNIPRDLAVICLKCLEKDPTRRYGSAEALAEELQRWLADEPIQARRTTLPERAWKWARRKPAVACLLIAVLLVAKAGIVGILLQTRRANIEAKNARAESRRAESELWKGNLNEARALRTAGGPGARIQSSKLLQKLVQRPDLTETQILKLRQEAIAQLALFDIEMPTNWVLNLSRRRFGWNSNLDRYVWHDRSNRIELREFPSEKILAAFSSAPTGIVESTAFSSDDRFIAALFSNDGGELRVWRLDTREQVLGIVDIEGMEISPDSRTLLTVDAQGVTLRPLAGDGRVRLMQSGRRVAKATFSPDSKCVAVLLIGPSNEAEIWDADSGRRRGSFHLDFPPRRVAWHPDGNRLALGGDRGRLEVRNLDLEADGSFRVSDQLPLTGHLGALQRLHFSPGGATLMTYAWEPSSIVWDLTSGRPLLREQRADLGAINSTGDRVNVARNRHESVAALIDRTGYRTVAAAGQPREAQGVWVSPDGRLGVVSYDGIKAGVEGDCILWDFLRGGEIARFKGVWAAFSADSQTLFTFERFEANRIRRYDVSVEAIAKPPRGWSEGGVLYQRGNNTSIHTGGMASDGRTLVVAATDSVLFIDTLGEKPMRSWAKAPAYSVVLSSDGKWAATGIGRQPAALRALGSGDAEFRAPNDGRIRFSANSRWMATIDRSGIQMRRLDVAPFLPIYTIDFDEPGPLAFSPDNRIFAVAYNKKHVRLFETSNGRELATLSPAHLAPISGGKALEFSPDGQWLIAAKHDGETVAWNIPVVRRELAKLGLDWKDRQE